LTTWDVTKRLNSAKSFRCVVEAIRRVLDCRPGGDFGLYDQANKRLRWMPWRSEAKKDVAACEKRGGAGNKH
jgi:hypothetical protein